MKNLLRSNLTDYAFILYFTIVFLISSVILLYNWYYYNSSDIELMFGFLFVSSVVGYYIWKKERVR